MGRYVADVEVIDIEKRRYPSKHYVYLIRVTWNDDVITVIYRRYSNFFELQSKLLDQFPDESGSLNPADRIIPFMPGKILIGRSHIEKVAKKRQELINQYCKALIKLPKKICQSEEVIQFFTSTRDDINPKSGPPEKASEPTGGVISDPMVLEQYRAIADYAPQAKKEVALKAGQMVDVIEKNEMGWWLVHAEDTGTHGWVPSSYLEREDSCEESNWMDEQPGDEDKKYMCLDHYEPDNEDEVPLDKGAVVDVVQKSLDGWWLVRYKGKQGLAPAAYLTEIPHDRLGIILKETQNPDVQALKKSPNGSPPGPRRNSSPRPSFDGFTNMLKKRTPTQSPEIRQKDRRGSSQPEQPSGGVEIVRTLMDDVSTLQKKTNEDGHSPRASPAAVNTPAEGQRKVSAFRMPSIDRKVSEPGSGKAPPRRGSIYERPKKRPPKRPVQPKFRKEYRTKADFSDSVGDGIDFKADEKVEILERSTSGWWLVKIRDMEGWAPSTYIEEREVPLNRETQPSSPAVQKKELQTGTPPRGRSPSPRPEIKTPVSKKLPQMNGQQMNNAAWNQPISNSDGRYNNGLDDPVSFRPLPGMNAGGRKRASSSCGNLTEIDYNDDEEEEVAYELYVSIAPYEKVEETEISFDSNMIIEVIEKNDDGWWLVKIDDDEGWAPESYLVKCEAEDEDTMLNETSAGSSACFPDSYTQPESSAPSVPLASADKNNKNFPFKSETVAPVKKQSMAEQQQVSKPAVGVKPKLPGAQERKPLSKHTTDSESIKHVESKPSKPSFKSTAGPPKLPSKPVTEKPKNVQEKETVSKSNVSSMLSKFGATTGSPSPPKPAADTGAEKVSDVRYKFGGPVTAPKPNQSKGIIAAKPKMSEKPSPISNKPKPFVQNPGRPRVGSGKEKSDGGDELSAVLRRQKKRVDSTSSGDDPLRKGKRNSGDRNSAGLHQMYNMVRPR